ncbi:hypothetical protein U27_00919 [Candidatus Vecturithrix granuli]|uniref:HepT-like domain-containing protein n=1 Tax=Vecturithrix granuli TaxID=1499967 RepID=A0A081C8W6_VECG1|nr:hypothetical protein U27_00919 [Candidatus Vecturithrix granuli]
MREDIRILQAEIRADLQAIAEAYQALHSVLKDEEQRSQDIVIGYYLNVLYGLFENLFERIAAMFENQIHNKAQWHAQLLRRMTLDIQDIRPRAISAAAYQCLDELRRFRHVFRNAYVLSFDAVRLGLVLEKALELERLYQGEIEAFLSFLDELAGRE